MWMALLAVVDRLAPLTLIRRDIGTDREDIASSRRRRTRATKQKDILIETV